MNISSNSPSSLGGNAKHQTDRVSAPAENSQISLSAEVVTFSIPSSNVLSEAFERVRTLENYLKPIVIEGIARKLGVSKKAVEKSYEIWMMERIERISKMADAQTTQNGEER